MTDIYTSSAALPVEDDTEHLVTHADLEALILEQKNHLLPPGGAEEVVVDVGEHTPTKKFKKNFEISQEFEFLYSSSKIWQMRTSSNVGPVGS